MDDDSTTLVLNLSKKMYEFNFLFASFSMFGQKQIVQSFLLDEIELTNKIENINSTRHDIFKIINQELVSTDKKIISISNAYKELLESKGNRISSNSDISDLYKIILNGAIEKEDLPDGTNY